MVPDSSLTTTPRHLSWRSVNPKAARWRVPCRVKLVWRERGRISAVTLCGPAMTLCVLGIDENGELQVNYKGEQDEQTVGNRER